MAEKRAHHNALERKRRDHIKDSFTSLRESVPALQGEKVQKNITDMAAIPPKKNSIRNDTLKKASRALILKKAADYIQFMRRKNSAHQQDIDDLKRQNTLLESQIRTLEKAKATGNFAAETSEVSLVGKPDGMTNFQPESESDTSDSETSHTARRPKKLKVAGL